MVKNLKLFFIIGVLAFFIGCQENNNKNFVEKNTEILSQSESIQSDFIELKKDMKNNTYGIKKETLTISDTSHKNMTFKINYPYFYTIKENEIVYKDEETNELLISIQKSVFGSDTSLNSYGVESSTTTIGENQDIFDYDILYQDSNFLSFSYKGVIEIYGTNALSHPFLLNKNIYVENERDYFRIKEIKLDDIVKINEIENYLNNNKRKLLDGNELEIENYFSEIDLENFSLKDNNKIDIVINLPRSLGSYFVFEMECNWKDILLNKYKN